MDMDSTEFTAAGRCNPWHGQPGTGGSAVTWCPSWGHGAMVTIALDTAPPHWRMEIQVPQTWALFLPAPTAAGSATSPASE